MVQMGASYTFTKHDVPTLLSVSPCIVIVPSHKARLLRCRTLATLPEERGRHKRVYSDIWYLIPPPPAGNGYGKVTVDSHLTLGHGRSEFDQPNHRSVSTGAPIP
jgi:hypothetical protein